jgi:hypothetical protein
MLVASVDHIGIAIGQLANGQNAVQVGRSIGGHMKGRTEEIYKRRLQFCSFSTGLWAQLVNRSFRFIE